MQKLEAALANAGLSFYGISVNLPALNEPCNFPLRSRFLRSQIAQQFPGQRIVRPSRLCAAAGEQSDDFEQVFHALIIPTLDVLNGLVYELYRPAGYEVRDLLAHRLELNRLKIAQIKFLTQFALHADCLSAVIRPLTPRSALAPSSQSRTSKQKGAPFSARLNFFSL
jgi:hypothetical protein